MKKRKKAQFSIFEKQKTSFERKNLSHLFTKTFFEAIFQNAGTKCIIGTLDNILVGGDGIHLTFYTFVYMLSV